MVPAVRWYLRKERRYHFNNIKIKVPPGVFHPGLFHSTQFLIEYLETQNLRNSTLLDVGCGSGLISIFAAKAGATVTAIDLSLTALDATKENAVLNEAHITSIHSDLFEDLDERTFDWIIVNPPYYNESPKNDEDLAWYCGENFEYFKKFFSTINKHIHPATRVIMVLTKGCDLKSIHGIASQNNFKMNLIKDKRVLFDERDFLYKVEQVNSSVEHQG